MHKHRLDRLAKLTQGAALVGIGAVFACRSDSHTMNAPEPDPTPHINASAEPVHTNAPPEPEPSASASAAPSAGQSPPSTGPSARAPTLKPTPSLRPPMHVNAPPHTNTVESQ